VKVLFSHDPCCSASVISFQHRTALFSVFCCLSQEQSNSLPHQKSNQGYAALWLLVQKSYQLSCAITAICYSSRAGVQDCTLALGHLCFQQEWNQFLFPNLFWSCFDKNFEIKSNSCFTTGVDSGRSYWYFSTGSDQNQEWIFLIGTEVS